MKNILLIDDSDDFRETTKFVLLEAGYDVFEASSPLDAYPFLKNEIFDLIVCDLHLPFATGETQGEFAYSFEVGVKTIRELREALPRVPIVALSSASASDLTRISSFLDPIPAFHKPESHKELIGLVEQQLSENPLERVLQ